MDYDDEYDEEYDDALEYEDSDYNTTGSDGMKEEEGGERSFDPLDITNPKSAYFFLSDDAQDEIEDTGKKKMRCFSCGHRFMGEIYDDCPECFSDNTEEIAAGMDEKEDTFDPSSDEFWR